LHSDILFECQGDTIETFAKHLFLSDFFQQKFNHT